LRTVLPFNTNWLFCPEEVAHEEPDSRFDRVTLPHTNIVLPHHNFDNAEYQFVSTYRKRFSLPQHQPRLRVYVDFDGAMIAAVVYLNGHKLGEHLGGYTPFSFELTEHLIEGENVLTVHLDSTERPDIPPYGFVVDYLTFGGIYRDVTLRIVEPCHITNVFVKPQNVLTASPRVDVDIALKNQGDSDQSGILQVVLKDGDGQVLATAPNVAVMVPAEGKTVAVALFDSVSGITCWSLDNPALYMLEVTLTSGETALDRHIVRFGFRETEFRQDGGFYLNGKRLDLIGLNRHQTYPYIGAAAPARLQRQDADILKYELGLNLVRTSHYPQSVHFIDRCDEIGLLVFEEIPGWQHIGDKEWQALSLRDVRAMIERDRNHPSIILWGVRINESADNEAFYTATNALAHELDPTRQTGGVRYFQDSQFLEDVFTFNDFSNTIVEPKHIPHLVCEFNGHMFPTKSWDHEEQVVEHALRHARIQDKQLGMNQVAGAIGWCAFDYNTHKEFGSGDRICYHGVMDIFRLPKYAAYFYVSQVSPQQRVVLQGATIWSLGDRRGDNYEWLFVFSNCEAIEVFVGDEKLGRFEPDHSEFPHLPHPPYQIRLSGPHMTWGKKLPDLRLVGYLDGQAIAEHRVAADSLPHALTLKADFDSLQADGMDMTRLVFKIVDRFGNPLPYVNQVVTFEIDGPAELLGENPFALMGGQAALYLRAGHTPGTATVRATTPRLEPVAVSITLH
jgi:beta-galactosidase